MALVSQCWWGGLVTSLAILVKSEKKNLTVQEMSFLYNIVVNVTLSNI